MTQGPWTENMKFKQFVEEGEGGAYLGWGLGTKHCIMAPLPLHIVNVFSKCIIDKCQYNANLQILLDTKTPSWRTFNICCKKHK